MTVETSQVPATARRVMAVLLWLALAVIVVIAAVNTWIAFSSGDPIMGLAALIAGTAPVLLAILVRRHD
ncbi:hypothetical protein ACTI_57220 [Actinoplanes sp. OR16]|uniref:hypothetical protein n=1 Tax=Actinoplanes sp. OR16 TaxID=946334 RepID=UPI000F6CB8BA|nr:hypothetical protein [Actinoplanes sp. OR16]BBH69037.1 hypothetical protein ACTI_57220 [Actinoplanes sp. OR16]